MADTLYEVVVPRRPSPRDTLIRVLVIVAIVLLALSALVLTSLLIWVAIILGFVAYYFIWPRLNVEYEYTYFNGSIDVAAIYSRQSRKNILSFDVSKAEMIAPADSHELDYYRNNQGLKTMDFSSQDPEHRSDCYAFVVPVKDQRRIVLIEPDERMLKDIRIRGREHFSRV